MDKVECLKCHKENRAGANFCAHCGVKINVVCPKCWMKNKQAHNCGFDKCPSYKLTILEKSKD